MTSAVRPGSTRRGGRDRFQYLVGGLVLLAAGASVVAVFFSDNTRLLLLGVVAALWAAVVASIAMTRSRREAATAQARAADLKTVYDLELEREISARRMHEYQVERTVREEVRAEATSEMAELREELRALRENLAALLGGELLVERVALRAESTRLRSLSDTARLAAGAGALEHRRDVEDAVEEAAPHPDDVRAAGSTDTTDVFPRVDDEPVGRAQPLVASRDPEPEDVPEAEDAAEHGAPAEDVTRAVVPEPADQRPEPEPVVAESAPAEPAPAEPEPVVAAAAKPEPTDESHDPEPAGAQPVPEPVEPDAGSRAGRRRRPDPVATEPDVAAGDGPAAVDEPEEHDDEGAHSAGRSVSELMAAYGVSAGTTPRRRRRAD